MRDLRRRLTPEGNLVQDWADDPQFWWNWLTAFSAVGLTIGMVIGMLLP